MSPKKIRMGKPDDWWTINPTPVTREYESFFDELRTPLLTSGVPYSEASWRDHFIHASNKPLWKIKNDYPGASMGLDMIAMAERFSPGRYVNSCGAAFGGAGADSNQIWIPALDGGVLLKFIVVEDERTNALSAYQETIVGGSGCFRFLLRKLGFKSVPRRLKGEAFIPTPDDIERLAKEQATARTEAHEKLLKAAANPPESWFYEF
jgi:hypothetical protein